MKNKTVLFYLNHPAHFHLFSNAISQLSNDGYQIVIVSVAKDVLDDLLKSQGWAYTNIFPEGRRDGNKSIWHNTIVGYFKTLFRLIKVVRKAKPGLLIGTEGTLAHVGFLLGVASFLFNEDDTKATPENYLFYPFATKIVLPNCCDAGQWKGKRISYDGYHELAYLHPQNFFPDFNVVQKFIPDAGRYFILRLAQLTASHDAGKTGITDAIAGEIIDRLEKHGKVFISSERPLSERLEKYRLNLPAQEILHALYYADLYIGDSQTMAAEAAVMGTPSIRFNDFVGKLGYLNELERQYELTFGIATTEPEKLYAKIEELVNTPNLKSHYANKRKIMLVEQINTSSFFIDVIKERLPLEIEQQPVCMK